MLNQRLNFRILKLFFLLIQSWTVCFPRVSFFITAYGRLSITLLMLSSRFSIAGVVVLYSTKVDRIRDHCW